MRLPLPSSTSLNPKEAWEKASLFSLPYEPLSRNFQQILGFFRGNGRISRSVLRGIYATNELNLNTTTTEIRKLAKQNL